MNDHLTDIPGVPAKHQAVPGMAHFAGSGPFGKHCGDCRHKGYQRERVRRHPKPGEPEAWYSYGGCAMYRKLTGRDGPQIAAYNHACKYFEEAFLKPEKR